MGSISLMSAPPVQSSLFLTATSSWSECNFAATYTQESLWKPLFSLCVSIWPTDFTSLSFCVFRCAKFLLYNAQSIPYHKAPRVSPCPMYSLLCPKELLVLCVDYFSLKLKLLKLSFVWPFVSPNRIRIWETENVTSPQLFFFIFCWPCSISIYLS